MVSKRNAAWSFERGGVETGQRHYLVMVVLHTGLLVGCLVEVWLPASGVPSPRSAVTMLALVLASQALRWWCIATLGRRVEHAGHRRARAAPGHRRPLPLTSHPNYVAVVVEGFALPLVYSAWITAVVFTVCNAVLLTVRLRVENAALAAASPGPATAVSS